MRIAMIGCGYVGLVSGACFADFGHSVTCVDKDTSRIASLQRGVLPIHEPDLDGLVARNSREGRLAFTTELAKAVRGADAVFIAVGTPPRRGDGHADLSYVYDSAREIAAALDGFAVIIMKSTVPVSTADAVERIIRETRPGVDFAVVSNPEFLREGSAIRDFKHPDRIVVGCEDGCAKAVVDELYRPLSINGAPVLYVSRRTAELIKYSANAFLATKITFINEIAELCEKVGADVQDVARGIGLDNRIGSKFLNAGPGFGGSCFPKDAIALIKTAQDYESPLRIVETVVAVNDTRKRAMARKVVGALGGTAGGKSIALLGLTFKPNTDDMRGAPSISLVTALQDMGAKVRAYDPVGMEQAKLVLDDVTYCDGPYSCAEGADALVIVTEWEQFRALDFDRLRQVMAQPVLIDMRNIYRADFVRKNGFTYASIGRATIGALPPRHRMKMQIGVPRNRTPAAAKQGRVLP